MKKTIAISLVLILLFSSAVSAGAVLKAPRDSLSLSFSGTTAYCAASRSASGESISATMELWQGSILLAVWFTSGTGYVSLNKTASVISGKTYTLKFYGTSNGIPFSISPKTLSCP